MTNTLNLIKIILISFLLLTACSAAEDENKNKITCKEPRPQICTREYNPVCATLQDGSEKTYATGCTACAEKIVSTYRPGACQ